MSEQGSQEVYLVRQLHSIASLPDRLRFLRHQRRLTLEMVTERCGLSGAIFSRFVNRKAPRVTLETMQSWAIALDIPLETLTYGIDLEEYVARSRGRGRQIPQVMLGDVTLRQIAKNIRDSRIRQGYSQGQLAKVCGISHGTVYNCEQELERPGLLTIQLIAKALKCQVADLLRADTETTVRDEDTR